MASLVNRMIRASKLDINLYEEVEADESSIGQAILVVVISSIASGIGSSGVAGLSGLVLGTVAGIIGWLFWIILVYIVGGRLLPEPGTRSDVQELLRTTGFAFSPGVLNIFSFIPFAGGIISIVVSIWVLVAMIIAVRQALDYKSTWRAILVCVIGYIVYISIFGFIVLQIMPIPAN